jgi:hypothetical protein
MYSMINKEKVTKKDFHYFITYSVAKLTGEVNE